MTKKAFYIITETIFIIGALVIFIWKCNWNVHTIAILNLVVVMFGEFCGAFSIYHTIIESYSKAFKYWQLSFYFLTFGGLVATNFY